MLIIQIATLIRIAFACASRATGTQRDGVARYSFPVNTEPDGWAALKASPNLSAPRLTKVYDGTLFLVVGSVPGWRLVRFKSGETGWIAARLVGCCRPAGRDQTAFGGPASPDRDPCRYGTA